MLPNKKSVYFVIVIDFYTLTLQEETFKLDYLFVILGNKSKQAFKEKQERTILNLSIGFFWGRKIHEIPKVGI